MKPAWMITAVFAIVAFLAREGKAEEKPAKMSAKAAREKPPAARITVSKETTRITGPLRPDGYVDYVAAINEHCREGVSPENNAAVLLWQAFGPEQIKKEHRQRFWEMLGIAPLPETGDYLLSLHKYAGSLPEIRKAIEEYEPDFDAIGAAAAILSGKPVPPEKDPRPDPMQPVWEQLDKASAAPWTRGELPIVAGWLEKNEKPLALIVAAAKRPRYYTPWVAARGGTMIECVLTPPIQSCREVTRALRARAMLKLGSRRTEEGWQDLLACHRLGRLVGQGPTLIDNLLGSSVEGIATEGEAAMAHYGRISAAQARRFRDDLRQLPAISLADRLDAGERYFYLDYTGMIARNGASFILKAERFPEAGNALTDWGLDLAGRVMIDWNVPVRMGNAWFDRMVAAARKPAYSERATALAEFDKEAKAMVIRAKDLRACAELVLAKGPRAAASQKVGEVLLSTVIPALMASQNAQDYTNTRLALLHVALAAGAYRADRGEYPRSLVDLGRRTMAEFPRDLFTGGEFHYKRQGDGCLLYSVGPNQRDDGGRNWITAKDDKERETLRDCDDIAIRVPPRDRNVSQAP
jgi:hypothetical protein